MFSYVEHGKSFITSEVGQNYVIIQKEKNDKMSPR